MDGSEIELKQEILDSLKIRLKGPVLTPGDVGYDESRTVWNGMIDRKPSIVVRCLGTADVIASVQFAREHGLLLSIKGGGHNIAGLSTADEDQGRIEAAPGKGIQQLSSVKAKWDPNNMFRMNRNIKPV